MGMNQPPGDAPERLPVDFRPRRLILLPYNDLLIDQGLDQFLSIDTSGFKLGLVLPYGMGPTEPKVFQMDAIGQLLTSVDLTKINGLPIFTVTTNVPAFGIVDALGTTVRMGSGGILGSLSSNSALTSVMPGQWSVQHSPATGAVATISRAAGAAGVRNICTGFSFGFSAGVAIAASSVIINLRDGASGVGGVLQSWIYDLPAAIIAPFTIEETGFEIPGTAATAMTLEFTAAVANLREFVNLSGHLAS